MCKECGCGASGGNVQIGGQPLHGMTKHDHDGHEHRHHGHEPLFHVGHDHGHHHGRASQKLDVNRSLLEKNDRQAERNRSLFHAKKLLVLNVLSSPGSGKTTLIRETAIRLAGKLRLGVIVGDLATENDAARLRKAGIPVVQITTGTVCHLDADMVALAAAQLDLDKLDLLILENVGNLVCPADFDLGEDVRVVLLSTTEGEDKPLKYPPMFHSAQVAIITKIELATVVGFHRSEALANLGRVSHHAQIFELSAKTGEGMEEWLDYLVDRQAGVPA